MAEKKYYWLKLKRDFFKRHDIRIIEEYPNGKEYILFYLKLLLESIDHEGELRFSETVPYNEQMLSTITNTNIDVVRSAMQLFISLNMIEVLDDDTIYMAEVNKLMGCETSVAERVRRHRQNQKLLQCNADVTKCNTEIDIDIEKDTEKEKEDKKEPQKRFIKPTMEEVQAYCQERNKGVDAQKWYDYYSANGWKVGRNPMKDWKASVRTWERNDQNGKHKVNDNRNSSFEYPEEC